MTRETKIGLLVGLGFIIVFAVLLSHNGTGPSPTQALPPIASASSPDSTPSAGVPPMPPPVNEPAPSPVAAIADNSEGTPEWRDAITGLASGTNDDLPEPPDFNRPGVVAEGPRTGEAGVTGALASADDPRDGTLESTRVVPTVVEPVEPEPTLRPIGPAVTEAPAVSRENVTLAGGDGPTSGMTHAAPAPPGKPYVVHKGDTLVKITKEVYGKSTPEVISFVVDANKGTIKNRDSLREGQTIMTPPLPADMFERTPVVAGGVDMRKVDHLLHSTDRRAPETVVPKPAPGGEAKTTQARIPGPPAGSSGEYIPAQGQKAANRSEAKAEKSTGTDKQKDAAKPAAPSSKADAGKSAAPPQKDKKEPTVAPKPRPNMRLYQIQPKDTFTSIAQRELGSGARWTEIKQLNKDVDPAKMKPGTKIKLPTREPLSADVSSKQVSA